MLYEYINEDTGEIIEEEYSMTGSIPAKVKRNGKVYRRKFSTDSVSFHIPDDFATTDNKIDYGSSPSGKKRYY